ncbi:transcription factor bHLH68-like isoform X1 [Vicia villosa]|uniref:transcription factor bHLH68-like isoform X1 n=1 Tax=Vicia villosa TaxID=3911 RepID=UPI00273C43EE|nr:transcription factor bHLH68-like isoform X1 [Vicia villosa]
MNRSVHLQTSPVQQQMMAGNPNNWWNPPAPDHLQPPSNYFLTPYPSSSSLPLPLPSWHENQQLPDNSWTQLLMSGGVVYEEDKEQVMLTQPALSASSLVDHVKHESSVNNYVYGNEEFHGTTNSTWSQIVSVPSSSSSKSSMLDFSNSARSPSSDPSSDQCNSGAAGGALKKARVQPSTTQSTFKVRKEKLGDRITALHQLVSPFGKTDTASVLLESIGYIRFLHSQIEVIFLFLSSLTITLLKVHFIFFTFSPWIMQALSLPYLGNGSPNIIKNQQQQSVQGEKSCFFPEHPGQLLNENCLKRKAVSEGCEEEENKDLKSRGLCLVPVSCTVQVGSENGADYWAPAFGAGFQ